MYDFLVGRFLSLSCGRPPTGQKARIVLDSIERLWCHLRRNEFAFFTTTLFLPSRTWFVFDALIGLDAWFLSRATDFRCGTRAELMAHFTTLSPSWDILLSLKKKESFFPGISWTVYLYLNYSEFFSLFMTLVQWHLSCSVVFLWSVDTIYLPRKTGTCKQSYSPTRTCGRATLGALVENFLY